MTPLPPWNFSKNSSVLEGVGSQRGHERAGWKSTMLKTLHFHQLARPLRLVQTNKAFESVLYMTQRDTSGYALLLFWKKVFFETHYCTCTFLNRVPGSLYIFILRTSHLYQYGTAFFPVIFSIKHWDSFPYPLDFFLVLWGYIHVIL